MIQDLEMLWTVNASEEMVFEKGRKYGVRFTIDNAEIWPHSSGIEPFVFSSDSVNMQKTDIDQRSLAQ